VVVCTVTALVIIITGTWDPNVDPSAGVQLTSAAFESQISWFPWVLTVAVVLFAFSTMISWSYYGLKCWTFLFGESRAVDYTYKALFLIFVVVAQQVAVVAGKDHDGLVPQAGLV
ncbi:MAG TPA: amino acid carrier protein, partial [Acidobacteria bacterium]|nr:amino acid carrier protein [Acidobacteriota bacterium]